MRPLREGCAGGSDKRGETLSARDTGATFRRNLPFELLPTNLSGAFTSPAPSPEFDPSTASPAQLAAHGIFWRRPGQGERRRVSEAWEHVARRRWRPEDRVVPRLDPHLGVSHRLHGARLRDDGTYSSDNWSGASLGPPRGERWSSAAGHWAIPSPRRPADASGLDGGWSSASWVGLDGAYGSDNGLQAGVEQRLDVDGKASYVAWCAWFAPEQRDSPSYIWHTDIANFAVGAGDVVACWAQYLATRAGNVFLANETTGQHVTITLRPPPGATFAGEAAEWIMETPDFGDAPAWPPAFSAVQFQDAVCYGQGIPAGDPVDGDTWIIQGFGITLTDVTVSSGSVTVAFVG